MALFKLDNEVPLRDPHHEAFRPSLASRLTRSVSLVIIAGVFEVFNKADTLLWVRQTLCIS